MPATSAAWVRPTRSRPARPCWRASETPTPTPSTRRTGNALAAARTADAYVVAVGEKAYAEGLGDNPAPALPPDQQALIKALEATGKPVIVVVIAGRPVGLGPAENANAC